MSDQIVYHILVFAFEDVYGNMSYTTGCTKQKPRVYIESKVSHWKKKGLSCESYSVSRAFESWKGTPRKIRLENHFKYCLIGTVNEKPDFLELKQWLTEATDNHRLDSVKWNTLSSPLCDEADVEKKLRKIYHERDTLYEAIRLMENDMMNATGKKRKEFSDKSHSIQVKLLELEDEEMAYRDLL